jgi:hypothetical protein
MSLRKTKLQKYPLIITEFEAVSGKITPFLEAVQLLGLTTELAIYYFTVNQIFI